MSITDDVRAEARPPSPSPGSAAAAREGGGFDRTPPQDIAAEQSVIGGMLLSKDAIADVVEILKSHDFYKPVHTTIYDTILELYGRGEPADAVTVTAALADAGDLARIGGVPYLHTVMETVPTAANAAYYARIVSERAVLRRLVEAGTKIVQLGYGAGGNGGRDVDDTVDLAQQAIYDVTERRVSEDFAVLADMLQPTLDEIEAVGASGGMMTGVPTGFSDLDRLLNGLHPGQLIIVAGRPGLGKALALDTPLATPTGWTTMAEVSVGDRLLGADGRPTTVIATSEVMVDRPCFEVEFSDGSTIVADAGHLWATRDATARRRGLPAAVRTTEQLAATVHTTTPVPRPNHSVTGPSALDLPERHLPVAAYTFGAWLGGGHDDDARISTADGEVHWHVEADGYLVDADGTGAHAVRLPGAPGAVAGLLAGLGVLGDAHIPVEYLRASSGQREALLAGLLDTGGVVTSAGEIRWSTASSRLAADVRELVTGLGHRCTVTTDAAGPVPTAFTVGFATGRDVFRLPRKVLLHKEYRGSVGGTGTDVRHIVNVRPLAVSVPVKCVSIDNADKLYLAGRAMVPTHNSTASMDFARHAAIRANCASAIFSLEMSKIEIVMRLLSAEARVPLHVLRSGQLSDDDWTKLARRMGEISEAPIFVDDTPSMNLMEIRAKARRLKQRHNLKLIVVDYLQLMSSPKKTESRQQEVAELSRGLKLLAKEVECPVIAVSQLNRGPEQRTDKRPQLSDLRESGCLTAGTRVMRADDNTEVTLGQLLASGARDIPVWALGADLRYTRHTMTHVFPSGTREVFRLTLASGKQIEATDNHPFLTFDGWRPLAQVRPGVRLATPRHVPPPSDIRPWPEADVVLLAQLLGGDASDPATGAAVADHFGITTATDPAGSLPADSCVPAPVFALPKEQITLFLRHLWAGDGSVVAAEDGRAGGPVRLRSASRRLLCDVSRLLLRYGISADLPAVAGAGDAENGTSPDHRYVLDISGSDDKRRFVREIGVCGSRAPDFDRLLRAFDEAAGITTVDTIPQQVWGRVRDILLEPADPRPRPVPVAATRLAGVPAQGAPGRARLARIADTLDAADLELHATNDVVWDEIVSVESLGVQDVYDATVPGAHNFIADGIATHNSIEQDADVVILLHRDDYYDKESPRAGEADFIVAKHRNGPTDTVTVAAQLHLSRFVDMAIV